MSRVTKLLLSIVAGLGLGLATEMASPADAEAQIYKYKKKDGTVVYTDSLAELPPDRRRYYNELDAAQKAERSELEAKIGKEELERREETARLAKEEEEAQQIREADERDSVLADIARKRQAGRKTGEAVRKVHVARYVRTVEQLKSLLAQYVAAQTAYEGIAMKAPHTLLPGEAANRDSYRAKMEGLVAQIDNLIKLVTETLPKEALKAGVSLGNVETGLDMRNLPNPGRAAPAGADDRGEVENEATDRAAGGREVDEGTEAPSDVGTEE
ncbi:MAG: DUF4124 domain-containing protein [Deltaproteobacteria bacterium]|nr:DUF4124 domain-containing protein [Deltaproteobacteria bacterium]